MKKSFILLMFIVLFLSCKSYKGEIPINTDYKKEFYISPQNMDGIKDSFITYFSVDEIKGLKVTGYYLTITSPTGKIVLQKTDGTPYEKKLVNVKPAKDVKIPKTLEWNGTDSKGLFLPDGVYTAALKAWDNKGNSGQIEPIKIHIDNTSPFAKISVPVTTFSPNTDSGLQVLTIFQESSVEELWEAHLLNESGNVVFKQEWNGILNNFSVNGFNNSQELIPDGKYTYEVLSTDLAGNSFSTSIDNIVIDRRESDLFYKNKLTYYFSPNNDGINDTIDIEIDSPSDFKLVNSKILFFDIEGKIVRIINSDDKTLPVVYTFDGLDNNNEPLAPGVYYSKFIGTLNNSKEISLLSNPIIIDVESPMAVVSTSFNIFSPEGDGFNDELSINQSSSIEEKWIGEIVNSQNIVVFSKEWNERAISFMWDGTDNSGKPVPDGFYSYNLLSTDKAGNSSKFTTKLFEVDRTLTPISIDFTKNSFSPNSDGVEDGIEFLLNTEVTKGILEWNISVLNSDEQEIYYKDGTNTPPKKLYWNGEPDQIKAIDGEYTVNYEVIYLKGNRPKVNSNKSFIVDITAPQVLISVPDKLFSPDNDGENDKIEIKISAKDNYNNFTYEATILDPTGKVFKRLASNQKSDIIFVWDGLSDSKELVQSATDYTVLVEAVDLLGNKSLTYKAIPVDILVLKDGNKLKIVISSIIFKPNTANFVDIEPDLYSKNIQTLNRLSEILKKYSIYQIELEGHAARVFWDSPTKWLKEEKDILLPLSINRADVIKDALVELGVKKERMKTNGYGGYQPVVPHSDLDNRWKNRRVEFILVK